MHTEIGFLERWSRRKLAQPAATFEPAVAPTAAPIVAPPRVPPTEADIAHLDASSDFARFLADDVASDVRVAAMRKLWTSDACLSAPDGLIDYAGDYTVAGKPPGTALQTAYRIGAGFLTEAEAELWRALGQPPKTAQTAVSIADADPRKRQV